MYSQNSNLELLPEFEGLLQPEFEKALYHEQEWSSRTKTAKKYTSPVFNWLSGSSNPSYSARSSKPLSEADIVRNAIAAGDRNENSLTDKVFFKRHPELGGRPLTTSMPDFSTLSREWLSIRDTLVRPLLKSPASPVVTPVTPTPGTQNPPAGSLRSNLATVALQEWSKWGQGSKKENDASMQSTLRDYWVSGTGSDYGYTNKLAWSAAFISWVVKTAGGGNNFQYSGAHTTYTYAAKQNRLQNNSNPFKAYRISEKKPEVGDIIVRNQDGYSFTYDNLQPDKSGTHGDIVVKVNAASIEVIGGNLSDSVSKNSSYSLNAAGYLNSSAHFAIIKIEAGTGNNEFEWESSYETMFPEMEFELQSEAPGGSRSSKEYIKWVQQSLNKILSLRLSEDGIRGTNTKRAIKSFQLKAGLKQDGIVGAITEAAILKALAALSAPAPAPAPAPLTAAELTAIAGLGAAGSSSFYTLRSIILGYSGVALREADRGLRTLLTRGLLKVYPAIITEVTAIANVSALPAGWSVAAAKPLLVGNTLYNLAFPETINQGTVDGTCFAACTQILLARRYPLTYLRYLKQLVTTSSCTYAGGVTVGPFPTFVSTSVYKSLDSVLLQTAFYYSYIVQVRGGRTYYNKGDELLVHRQVFGAARPPKYATYGSGVISAFRKAFVTNGGNTPKWEVINLTVTVPDPSWTGHHSVVITRVLNGRVYFYNPWPNETERNGMFGNGVVSVTGNGELPAEASMTQQDFEGQLLLVFHN